MIHTLDGVVRTLSIDDIVRTLSLGEKKRKYIVYIEK
jgi:hypothetical protein